MRHSHFTKKGKSKIRLYVPSTR